jgi:alcohol dehydrogenase class IV
MIDRQATFELGRIPRIRFGRGTFEQVVPVVARLGRHVLIVTGRSAFVGSDRWPALLDALAETRMAVDHETVPGEPTPAVIDDLLARRRGTGIDVVLGIGGGSALDTAKAAAGLLGSGTGARDHLEGLPGSTPYPGPALPWVAVPTTAGTGSEATRNAVLSERRDAPFKKSLRDERLVAGEAIVDPDLLLKLPPRAIAANGADALTQLLEGYTSRRATPLTDALALEGLAAARDALPRWHAAAGRGEDDPDARTGMAYAALLSGIVLANAGLGIVHGIVSVVGAHTDTPHGAGCGALLVAGIATNIGALDVWSPGHPTRARYATVGRLLADGTATDDAAARHALVDWLERLIDTLRLPGLATYGVTDALVPRLARESLVSSSTKANPVELTEPEVAAIISASR